MTNDNDCYNKLVSIMKSTQEELTKALVIAANKREYSIAEFLKSSGASLDDALLSVSIAGNKNTALVLKSLGASTYTALLNVSVIGDENAIKLLIEMGDDKNRVLLRAAMKGEVDAVKLLIKNGANKNSALLFAAQAREETAMMLLITEVGASTNSVLSQLIDYNSSSYIIGILIKHGADKENALVSAIRRSQKLVVAELIKQGTDNDIALLCAAEKGFGNVINILIGSGANKNNALLSAAKKGNAPAAKLLIQKGADKNFALMKAVQSKSGDAIKLLIAENANPILVLEDVVIRATNFIINRFGINRDLAKDTILCATKTVTDLYNTTPNGDLLNAVAIGVKEVRKLLREKTTKDVAEALVSVKEEILPKEDMTASLTGDNNPDSDSGSDTTKVFQSSVKRSRDIKEEDDEAANSYHYSSKSHKIDNDRGSSSNGNNEGKTKKLSENNTNKEDIYVNNYSILHELKTHLNDFEIPITDEERTITEIEKKYLPHHRNQSELNTDEKKISIHTDSQASFDNDYGLKNKQYEQVINKEISILNIFGKWFYELIENSLSSPLIFSDKADIFIFSPSNYDYGIPKLEMDSSLFNNIHETF